MPDKLIIANCGDIPFDTRPAGALYVENGQVKFDHDKTFNAARRILNKGGNLIIVERFARTDWTPPAAVEFDWQSPGYFELLWEYVKTIHNPVQGETTLPGVPVVLDIFLGCVETWQYDPANYPLARLLIQNMFVAFKDLPYVRFSPGREVNAMNGIDQGTIQAFMNQVVYSEFEAAGQPLFAYGACYKTTNPPYMGDLEQQKGLYDRLAGEPAALSVWRKVHNVTDENSASLIETINFWFRNMNPNLPAQIKAIFSVDGSWGGTSDIDFITLANGQIQRRPSGDQMKSAIRYIIKNSSCITQPDGSRKIGFEYMSKAMTIEVVEAQLQAIAEVYFELFGVWPENYGKYPNDWAAPLPPAPEPIPTPIPVPVLCSFWYHVGKLNFKAAWEHLRGLHG